MTIVFLEPNVYISCLLAEIILLLLAAVAVGGGGRRRGGPGHVLDSIARQQRAVFVRWMATPLLSLSLLLPGDAD